MELRDYLRILRRRWMLVLTSTLIVVAAAAAYTFTVTPMYQSTAKLFISSSADGGETVSGAFQGAQFSQQRVTSYAEFVKDADLAAVVVDDLDLTIAPSALRDQVTATVSPETVIIALQAQDASPSRAQAIAQGYASALADQIRAVETPVGETEPLVRPSVTSDATLPTAPVSPQPVRNLGLALVLGLLLGVGLAVARELLDTTVKSVDDIRETTAAPLLGAINFDSQIRTEPLVTSLSSHAPRAEAFRVLRTNLQFIDVDATTKVFVVTSALPGRGQDHHVGQPGHHARPGRSEDAAHRVRPAPPQGCSGAGGGQLCRRDDGAAGQGELRRRAAGAPRHRPHGARQRRRAAQPGRAAAVAGDGRAVEPAPRTASTPSSSTLPRCCR